MTNPQRHTDEAREVLGIDLHQLSTQLTSGVRPHALGSEMAVHDVQPDVAVHRVVKPLRDGGQDLKPK